MKFVHKELKTLFLNSVDIFIPFQPCSIPDQRPPVPIVDWSKVKSEVLEIWQPCRCFPSMAAATTPTYMPSGVMIEVPTVSFLLNIVNGYVWSQELQCWVIHARYLMDNFNTKEESGVPLISIPSHCWLACYCLSHIHVIIIYMKQDRNEIYFAIYLFHFYALSIIFFGSINSSIDFMERKAVVINLIWGCL